MTNREWLLNKMQNMSDEELAKTISVNYPKICKGRDCSYRTCDKCKADWFKEEHKEKITLSEAERIILENIDKEYQWICRDGNGTLKIYIEKPQKSVVNWLWSTPFTKLNAFNHLFQFITWNDEQPYNIAELLEEKTNGI